MAPSSPYAPFKAEDWMRASVITPRKRCQGTVGSKTPTPATRSVSKPTKKAGIAIHAYSWIQGDLFQVNPLC